MNRLIAIILVVAACGKNQKTNPDAPSVDAAPMIPTAVVAAGDFTAGHPGILSTVNVATSAVTQNAAPAGSVGDDPVLRTFGTELFVVNRSDGNNVTILDATTHALVMQLATGAGSNPQDVAVKGDKLYVPVYGGTGLAVLTRGSTNIQLIDLGLEDPDGNPECVSVYLVGDDLYVACDLLDANFVPRGLGKVYVVNSGSGLITHAITMQTKNPYGSLFHQLPTGELVISTVDYSNGTGCVEKITTGPTPASAGCIVTNTQLGGAVSRIELQTSATDTVMWLAVSASDFVHANLQSFDLGTNTLAAMPVTPATESVLDLAMCPDGTIAIADQTMVASGVRIYKNAQELTTAALPVGLPTKSSNALLCY